MLRRRNRYYRSAKIPLILMGLLFIIILYLSYHLILGGYRLEQMAARTILIRGMPITGEQEAHSPGNEYTYRSLIYLLTDFDLGNPRTILDKSIPLLAATENKQKWTERPFFFVPELTFGPEITTPDAGQVYPETRIMEPVVLIYHTHSSEMYLGDLAGKGGNLDSHYVFSSTNDEKITGVMEVGNHLAEALRRQGIGVLHDSRIHDWPSLAISYQNSERTVKELLSKNPGIKIVFDIHRDADVPQPVVSINGQQVARVLLVVGTAQDIPQAHPNWQSNLQFAQKFYQLAEELYPNLMRPMQVRRDARFNQHLHGCSVVVEVGSVENTIEEALRAAELVAHITAELLLDSVKQGK